MTTPFSLGPDSPDWIVRSLVDASEKDDDAAFELAWEFAREYVEKSAAGKNLMASAYGRLGNRARNAKLTQGQRSEIARKAGLARQAKARAGR